jgi:hypothetical protein
VVPNEFGGRIAPANLGCGLIAEGHRRVKRIGKTFNLAKSRLCKNGIILPHQNCPSPSSNIPEGFGGRSAPNAEPVAPQAPKDQRRDRKLAPQPRFHSPFHRSFGGRAGPCRAPAAHVAAFGSGAGRSNRRATRTIASAAASPVARKITSRSPASTPEKTSASRAWHGPAPPRPPRRASRKARRCPCRPSCQTHPASTRRRPAPRPGEAWHPAPPPAPRAPRAEKFLGSRLRLFRPAVQRPGQPVHRLGRQKHLRGRHTQVHPQPDPLPLQKTRDHPPGQRGIGRPRRRKTPPAAPPGQRPAPPARSSSVEHRGSSTSPAASRSSSRNISPSASRS